MVIIRSPHKNGAAAVALCTLMSISTGQAAGITICPQKYGQLEWDNCLGVYYFPDGTRYVGQFQNNKFHGWGALVSRSRWTCVGFVERGKLVGTCLPQKPKKKGDGADENRNIFANSI